MIKKEILTGIMMHRQRVSLKMSTIANDIAANGRRHDNSYTGDVELRLIEMITKDTNPNDKEHHQKMLDSVHETNNDYYPSYHDGIGNMNMIQLIEFIVDKVARIEAREDRPADIEGYKTEVIKSLEPISDDLNNVICNTVEYVVDRNKAVLVSLNKQVESDTAQSAMAKASIEGGLNYGA